MKKQVQLLRTEPIRLSKPTKFGKYQQLTRAFIGFFAVAAIVLSIGTPLVYYRSNDIDFKAPPPKEVRIANLPSAITSSASMPGLKLRMDNSLLVRVSIQ